MLSVFKQFETAGLDIELESLQARANSLRMSKGEQSLSIVNKINSVIYNEPQSMNLSVTQPPEPKQHHPENTLLPRAPQHAIKPFNGGEEKAAFNFDLRNRNASTADLRKDETVL